MGLRAGRPAGSGKCVLTHVCVDAVPVACFGGLLLHQSLPGGYPKGDVSDAITASSRLFHPCKRCANMSAQRLRELTCHVTAAAAVHCQRHFPLTVQAEIGTVKTMQETPQQAALRTIALAYTQLSCGAC